MEPGARVLHDAPARRRLGGRPLWLRPPPGLPPAERLCCLRAISASPAGLGDVIFRRWRHRPRPQPQESGGGGSGRAAAGPRGGGGGEGTPLLGEPGRSREQGSCFYGDGIRWCEPPVAEVCKRLAGSCGLGGP